MLSSLSSLSSIDVVSSRSTVSNFNNKDDDLDSVNVSSSTCNRSARTLLEPTKTVVAVKSRRRERALAPSLCQVECASNVENGDIMILLRTMFRAFHDALSPPADNTVVVVVVGEDDNDKDNAVRVAARSLAQWYRNDSSTIPSVASLQVLFSGGVNGKHNDQALHIAKWLHIYLTRSPASNFFKYLQHMNLKIFVFFFQIKYKK